MLRDFNSKNASVESKYIRRMILSRHRPMVPCGPHQNINLNADVFTKLQCDIEVVFRRIPISRSAIVDCDYLGSMHQAGCGEDWFSPVKLLTDRQPFGTVIQYGCSNIEMKYTFVVWYRNKRF